MNYGLIPTAKVGDLKSIKLEKSHMCNVDADNLQLWKTSISNNDKL